MPISHINKLIFIHIPKNAGTSITNSIGMGFSHVGHHFPSFYQTNFPNEWKNYKKFAVVRNPWDRVVSNYEYSKMLESYWHSSSGKSQYGIHPDYQTTSNLSFKETLQIFSSNQNFLKHQGWAPQYPYAFNSKDENLLDYIFKLDEITNNKLFQEIVPNLIFKNKSNRKYNNYREYYDDETIEIVSTIYAKDIKLFNFVF